MTARATEITDALLARLSAVPGFAVSYGPPRGGVQAGYLYLIAESDAQARSDDARQPNARLRERSYRVEVYLARGARYYAAQDDALRSVCDAMTSRPPARILEGLAYSVVIGDATLDDPALGSDLATLAVPITVRYAEPIR